MDKAITLMREAFVDLAAGRAEVPVRTAVQLAGGAGTALVMPAYLPARERLGLKLVTVHPGNPDLGLPATRGLLLVADATDGRPLALMDAERLTAVRTGAASALATDLLARDDATVAAVFGAGAQAKTQLEGISSVRPIARALVFGRSQENAARYAAEMTERLGLPVVMAVSPEQLREADIVCTATTSSEPVFSSADLKPGVHINGVGSFRPDMAEVPAEGVRAAKVVVDHRPSCLTEAGDLIQPIEAGLIDEGHIWAELGEIAAGDRPARESSDETTFFKSVGNAIQDVAVASYVAARAEELDLGTVASL